MEYSRKVVVEAFRREGMTDAAAKALELPDPVDSVTLVDFCEQQGVSKEKLMDLLGSGP